MIVASLIRLVEQLKVENPDFTCKWTRFLSRIRNINGIAELGAMNGMVIWTSIEPSVGVISACLPTLRPLVTYLFGRRASPSSKDANSSGLKHHDIMKKWYANTPHWDSNKESHTVSTAYPVIRAAQIQTTSNPECDGKLLGQISVRKDIHMKSEVV